MKHMPQKVEAMPVLVMWFLLTASALVVSLQLVPAAAVTVGDSNTAAPLPDCPSNCGDVEIPYPFGIGENCSWQGMIDFTITCNHNFDTPRPYTGNIEVINISVETGEMRIFTFVSYSCYSSIDTIESYQNHSLSLLQTFLISPTKNVFTAIGCDTLAFLDCGDDSFIGCTTNCLSFNDSALDGDPCAGLGCCQNSIPGNLSKIEVTWNTGEDHANNSAWEYSPCNYAFVAEKNWYNNFSRRDFNGMGNESFLNRVGDRTVPLVLDWAIRGNGSCQMAAEATGAAVKRTAPACASAHSYCIDVDARQGGGYRCNCSEGYMGYPYIPHGCTNINECQLQLYSCPSGSNCIDTDGKYRCQCKFGRKGEDCRPIFPAPAAAILATLVASLLLSLLLWFVHVDRKRRMKIAFFDKNGGKILKGAADINIFTEVQLNKFTNHYKTLIGRGSFGMVFMGITDENQQVAVKRSVMKGNKLGGDNFQPGDDIVNEITFQFRNRHPNLVRLVGCCLETNIPVLVFEYIPNGSLYNLLHVATQKVLPLLTRLKIAIGSAEALAYIHSHVDHERIHGDVKSANILLDDNLMPKVSDFGSSKLLSIDRYAMAVAADMSYVDPVYMKTELFVKKSDVYSFGMVLLELITRKTVKYGKNRINSLPMDFVKSCKEKGNGREMYDTNILSHGHAQCHHCIECLDKIGALAVRCLKEDVDERPTMAEVVDELKQAAEIVDKCKQQGNIIAYGPSCFEIS